MVKRILEILALSTIVGLNACAHTHEGPMEKAGRKTDNAASDVKEGTKKAADDVKGN